MSIEAQECIELQFNPKVVNKRIKEVLLTDYYSYITKCVQLVNCYLSKDYYESKNKRISLLKELDVEELVIKLLVKTCQFQRPELLASAVGQTATYLGFDDQPAAIVTVAELLTVMCDSNAFDIEGTEGSSMYLVSRLSLSEELIQHIAQTMYLPPMVCEPVKLAGNRDTGYLMDKGTLVLGRDNHHEGDLCLDVLNICNGVKLQLNEWFVKEYPYVPKKTPEDTDQLEYFKEMQRRVMLLLAKNGNEFWLTHRTDKRGRIYSMGYHITTQGSSWQKASIKLAKKEYVELP